MIDKVRGLLGTGFLPRGFFGDTGFDILRRECIVEHGNGDS